MYNFVFASLIRLYLQRKVSCFLTTRKYQPIVRDSLANENKTLAVRTFHNSYRTINFHINPFQANSPVLYPLKNSEKWKFSNGFRRCNIFPLMFL